jgi:hypothetical protein
VDRRVVGLGDIITWGLFNDKDAPSLFVVTVRFRRILVLVVLGIQIPKSPTPELIRGECDIGLIPENGVFDFVGFHCVVDDNAPVVLREGLESLLKVLVISEHAEEVFPQLD